MRKERGNSKDSEKSTTNNTKEWKRVWNTKQKLDTNIGKLTRNGSIKKKCMEVEKMSNTDKAGM